MIKVKAAKTKDGAATIQGVYEGHPEDLCNELIAIQARLYHLLRQSMESDKVEALAYTLTGKALRTADDWIAKGINIDKYDTGYNEGDT